MESQNIIDLNTASASDLTALPGIGPAMAERIIKARPFATLDDLQRVSGLGSAVIERISDLVSVSPVEMQPGEMAEAQALEPQDSPEKTPIEAPTETTPEPEIDMADKEPVSQLAMQETASEEPQIAAPEETSADILPETTVLQPEETPTPVEYAVTQASTSGTQQAVAEEIPTPLPPSPAATATKQPGGVSLGQVIGIAFVSGLLSFFLAVVVILGLLAAINGGLNYARTQELVALKQQVSGLQTQAVTLEQDLGSLRARLDNLDSLAGRISALEKDRQQLRNDLENVVNQSQQITRRVEQINGQVIELQASTVRFQNFLDGLRELLNRPPAP